MSFKEKILWLNSYFKNMENKIQPDLILISIPFGLSDFSTKCYNQFGYYGCLISKAISIDIGVLNLPFLDSTESELEQMSFDVFHRYGIPVEFFNICSKLLLINESEIFGATQYLEIDDSFVKSKIDSGNMEKVYTLKSQEHINELVEKMLCRLTYFRTVKTV